MLQKIILNVMKEKKYKIKFAYAFFIILIIAAFVMNFISLPGILQGRIIFTDVLGFASTAFLLVFSFLTAIVITLNFYRFEKFKTNAKGKEKIGVVGAFLGVFTSACSLCYPLVLSFIGIPTALAILPFGGSELQLVSIALLILSLYFIARNIENSGKCNINQQVNS